MNNLKRLLFVTAIFTLFTLIFSSAAFALIKIPDSPSIKTTILPAAPTGLAAEDLGPNSIRLTWEDNSGNESGFRIERGLGLNSTSFTLVTEVDADTTSYTNTGLNCGYYYTYRIRSYNNYGNSAYAVCNAESGSCAPTALTAKALSDSEIKLTWEDNSATERFFRIERGGVIVGQVNPNVETYTDTGLSAHRTYKYRVEAYIGFIDFDHPDVSIGYSNEATATTLFQVAEPEAPAEPEEPAEQETAPDQDDPGTTEPGGQTVIRLYIGSNEYYVNGSLKGMDAVPVIMEGRTMLPIRYVAEPLGAAMGWDAAEQKVTISMEGKLLELWIGRNQAKVNGQVKRLDDLNASVAPIIVPPGRTMLPLRFIAENLGCQVGWNALAQEVTITYPAP